MNRKEKARLNLFLRYLLLIGLGIVMIRAVFQCGNHSAGAHAGRIQKRV